MLRKAEHPLTFIFCFGLFLMQTLVYKHPFYVLFMFAATLFLGLLLDSAQIRRNAKLYLYLGIAVLVINPLLNRMGSTALIRLGGLKVSLESVSYGIFAGLSLVTVLVIFAILNYVIAPDRLTGYIFRSAPKNTMVMAMAFNYIPEFQKRILEIKQILASRGMFTEKKSMAAWFKDNIILMKVVLYCGLEDSIQIAASMECRGYGNGKRTTYERYNFNYADLFLLGLGLVQLILLFWAVKGGLAGYEYYPQMQPLNIAGMRKLHYLIWMLSFGAFIGGEAGDRLWSWAACKR